MSKKNGIPYYEITCIFKTREHSVEYDKIYLDNEKYCEDYLINRIKKFLPAHPTVIDYDAKMLSLRIVFDRVQFKYSTGINEDSVDLSEYK